MLNDIGLRTGVDGILVHSKLNPVENGPAPGFVVPPQTERKLKELGLANNLWHKYKEVRHFMQLLVAIECSPGLQFCCTRLTKSRLTDFGTLYHFASEDAHYASPSSGEAYRDRRLTTNF